MTSVERREINGNVRWRVRWRDPQGKQRCKSFPLRKDAVLFRDGLGGDLARGDYLDPTAGKVSFYDYATSWLSIKVFPSTGTWEDFEQRLRVHVFPVIGGMQIRGIKTSTIRSWLASLTVSPRTQKAILTSVAAVFNAAIEDNLIRTNPCKGVRPPKPEESKARPWSMSKFGGVCDALPAQYRIAAVLGFGLGLRQGEILGLAVHDVDFLRGEVTVQRQVKLRRGRPYFAPPKGKKIRVVPLPPSVRDALAAHLAAHPAVLVTLPWDDKQETRSVPLVLTTRQHGVVNRNTFNTHTWKPALRAAGVSDPGREDGMHALRHTYASVLLDEGESIRALSEYLGHSDPGFTLRTYTHLMPTSYARTCAAVDGAFGSLDPHRERRVD